MSDNPVEDFLDGLEEQLANEEEEALVHPIAEATVEKFAEKIDQMLEQIPQPFQHFLSCSAGVLMETNGLAAPEEETERKRLLWLAFCLLLLGMYIEQQKDRILWLITSPD